MKVLEAVSTHQPHEFRVRAVAGELFENIDRVADIGPVLKIADEHLRIMANEFAHLVHAFIEGGRLAFQGIAARGQPVDPVEPQAFERGFGDMQMPRMRRIE